MHELPYVEAILKIAAARAKKQHAPVLTIHIVVGDLSSVVDDSLIYFFQKIRKPAGLEQATLSIRRTQAIALCTDCGAYCPVTIPLQERCAVCGSAHIHLDGGTECYIDSIDFIDETHH